MELHRKTFWTYFGGVFTVCCFGILPLVLMAVGHYDGVVKAFGVAATGALTSAIISLLVTWVMLSGLDTDRESRKTLLLVLIHDGQQMMRYGNLIGAVVYVGRKACKVAVLLFLIVCVILFDEDGVSGWGG